MVAAELRRESVTMTIPALPTAYLLYSLPFLVHRFRPRWLGLGLDFIDASPPLEKSLEIAFTEQDGKAGIHHIAARHVGLAAEQPGEPGVTNCRSQRTSILCRAICHSCILQNLPILKRSLQYDHPT